MWRKFNIRYEQRPVGVCLRGRFLYTEKFLNPPEHLPGFIWEIHRKGKKANALSFGTGGGELVWGNLLLRMK